MGRNIAVVRVICVFCILIILIGGLIPVILQTPISSASGNNEAASVFGPKPCSAPTSIWSDDFETGSLSSNWTITGSTNNTGVGKHTANSGKYSMFTRQGSITVSSKAINLASYSKIQIKYWIRRGGNFSEKPDSGEDLIVEYLDSKSSWIRLDKFLGSGTSGQVYNRVHNLTTNATHKGFKIRFRQTGGSGNGTDYWHIDDVNILSLVKYDHDIHVDSINLPNEGKLAITIPIKTTIMNIGKNNETNITIQLKIDSVLNNSTNITHLSVDAETTITFNWTPMKEKVYTVGIYAVPVTSENITTNNQLNTTIKITAEPNIWITPKEFNLNATSGEITTDNLTIGNSGMGNLSFEVYTEAYFFDDVESGNIGWTHKSLNGSAGDSWNISSTRSNSSSNSWYSGSEPGASWGDSVLESPSITLGHDPILEFWHWYLFYPSFAIDGGIVEINDGSGWSQITPISGYPNTLGSRWQNPIGGKKAWGLTSSGWKCVEFNLSSYTGKTVNIRFHVGWNNINDTSGGEGWYIDDIKIKGTQKKVYWLSVEPNNGTITPSNNTILNVTANASNLDPGVYRTNITIISNDKTNTLIRLPVNFTVLTAAHDIKILNIEVPEKGEVGKKVQVKGTILNQGLNNEVNITIQLKVDGFLRNSTNVSALLKDGKTEVILSWVPMIEKNFTVEIVIIPVSGENRTNNNQLNDTIIVTAEPDIWLSKYGFDLQAMTGNNDYTNFTMGNSGHGTLDYQIEYDSGGNPGKKEVLIYTQWSDNSPNGEFWNTIAAINQTTTDYSFETFNDYNNLNASIKGKDILLIPEQENNWNSSMYNISKLWKARLNEFLDDGGTIVVCDHYGQTYQTFTGAGFMSIKWATGVTYNTVTVVDTNSTLVTNVNSTFTAPDGAIAFATSENGTVCKSGGYPVVIDKKISNGHAILIGFDYSSINELNANRIIGNCIKYYGSTKSEPDWLTLTPDNGTVSPFNSTIINITANATYLEPGLYKTNFTVIYNDPGEGPIRVPVNFTVTRAPHDIRVLSISIPDTGEAGKSIPIDAIILNQGLNNETNITVQLKVDGIVKNSTNISSLKIDQKIKITLSWIPMNEKTFVVEMFAVPIVNETRIINNHLNETIDIFAVPDIWLSQSSFDLTMIPGIAKQQNLTIGNDGLGTLDYQIKLLEVDKQGTSSTTRGDLDDYFSYDVDGNSKNDIFSYIYFYAYSSDHDTLYVKVTGYDGVSWHTIYEGTGGSRVVVDGNFSTKSYQRLRIRVDDTENNDDIYYNYKFKIFGVCKWLSLSKMNGSISPINTSKLVLTFNTSLLSPGVYKINITILNNDPEEFRVVIPVNLTVNRATHDIRVLALDAPKYGEVGKNTIVNSTIMNQGSSNEINIKIQLKVDGVVKNSTTISTLNKGVQSIINLGWVPLNEKSYSVMIHAVPVTGELGIGNNQLEDIVTVTTEPDILVNPDIFNLSAVIGTTVQENLTIRNLGYDSLSWNIGADKIIYESFPTTTFNSLIWSGTIGSPSINANAVSEPSYPYSVNLDGSGDTITSVQYDLSLSQKATLDFYYQLGGTGDMPEPWDYLRLEYYTNNYNWSSLLIVFGNYTSNSTAPRFYPVSIKLPANALHNQFQFRFSSMGSGAFQDDFFIDDIYLNFTSTIIEWLTFSSTSGNITKTSKTTISFWASAEELAAGMHQTSIYIISNDIDKNNIELPINFLVHGIYLEIETTNRAPEYVRQNDRDIIMANITLTANNSAVFLNSLTMNLTGINSDQDVMDVRLVMDADNSDDFSPLDIVLRKDTFIDNIIHFNVARNIPMGTPQTFFVIYNISNTAMIDNTVGVKISNGDIRVATPAMALIFAELLSNKSKILGRIDYLTVVPTDMAPNEIIQGQKDIPLMKLELSVNAGSVIITSIELELTGSGNSGDIQHVNLYFDSNGNGELEHGKDSLLSNKSFKGRSLTFNDLSFKVNEDSKELLFVLLDLYPDAKFNSTIGVRLKSDFISVNEPDIILPFEECHSGPMQILPDLELHRPQPPDGLSIDLVTYDSILLSWEENSETDVVGYNFYRSTEPYPVNWGLPINGQNPLIQLGYQDTGLNDSTTYYYVVTAVSDFPLESGYSDMVFDTTLFKSKIPQKWNPIEDFEIIEDSTDNTTINLYNVFRALENEKLTFWCVGQENIDVTIQQENGKVILKPKPNWNGMETLTFRASKTDEIVFASDIVNITVTPVNDPPGPAEIISPIEGAQIFANYTLVFKGGCEDPDLIYGDELTYTWFSNRSGKLGEDEIFRNVSLPIGYHRITLAVTDWYGDTTYTTVNITILPIITEEEEKVPVEEGEADDTGLVIEILSLITILILILLLLIFFKIKKKPSSEADSELSVEVQEPSSPPPSKSEQVSNQASAQPQVEAEKPKPIATSEPKPEPVQVTTPITSPPQILSIGQSSPQAPTQKPEIQSPQIVPKLQEATQQPEQAQTQEEITEQQKQEPVIEPEPETSSKETIQPESEQEEITTSATTEPQSMNQVPKSDTQSKIQKNSQ
jgi:hypothetical protein